VVLAESLLGVADGADHPEFEVGLAADVVADEPRLGVKQERVYREITAEHVFLGVVFEPDVRRVTAVVVVVVATESSDFYLGFAVHDQNDSEVGADLFGAREQGHHLVGARVGTYVIVQGLTIQKQVADTTADEVALEPVRP
jgi:hypothetical protein